MPSRHDQHVIADQAALDVRGMFVKLGYPVESVRQDYGEDLVVQGVLHEHVEPFRVLVQVKGTRRLKRRAPANDFAINVSTSHLRKWCASDDLVVVVLWDVTAKSGVWMCPRFELDDFDLFKDAPDGQSQVVFSDDSTFDQLPPH